MKLFVGLGNPEKKYDYTYHNLGFMAIDELAKILNINFNKRMCDGIVAETKLEDEKIFLLKPLTYMNLSGIAVRQMMKKFKIVSTDVVVFVDDIDLPLGKVRYRENGSAGTHNGLKSIVSETGSTDFKRIKIGIGRDERFEDLADFVLSKIPSDRLDVIEEEIDMAMQLAQNVIKNKKD